MQLLLFVQASSSLLVAVGVWASSSVYPTLGVWAFGPAHCCSCVLASSLVCFCTTQLGILVTNPVFALTLLSFRLWVVSACPDFLSFTLGC